MFIFFFFFFFTFKSKSFTHLIISGLHEKYQSSRKQKLLVAFVENERVIILHIFTNVMDASVTFFSWLSLPIEAVVRESKKEKKIIERMDSNLSNIGNKLVPKF